MIEMLHYPEVVRRLKEGENPIDLSINNWERIKTRLEEGYPPDTGYIGYCALCHVYDDDCDTCPLALHNPAYECEKPGSPFIEFRDEETVENAQVMIDALKELK